MQITALIVIGLGFCVAMVFQLLVPERSGINPPRLEWYKWLKNPQFYLVGCVAKNVCQGPTPPTPVQ